MKTTIFLLLLSLGLTSLFFIGCEPLDGNTTGDPRDQYVGKWLLMENFKSTESQSYIITISKDPMNSSQVIIGNLGNPGDQNNSSTGVVTAGQIVVSKQNTGSGWLIEGSGQLTSNTTMSWTYTITAGGNTDNYTATATLQ